MSTVLPSANTMPFEDLDDFLMSDKIPDDCMQLSDLDGFLTGVVVSPDLIMPSEWLPRIWGDGTPEFESDEEANQVIGAIMGRYNEILSHFSIGGDGHLDPVFWETPEGRVVAGDWAEGFRDAVQMRPEQWVEILEEEDARILIMPILALTFDENGNPFLDIDDDELVKINDEAVSMIPAAVSAIDQFWKSRRDHDRGISRGEPRRARKVGRNEPCPCGSGRKYKRCCGAN